MKSTSKKAFNKNVAAEVKAGRPVKQAVAIAYSVKREAAKKTTTQLVNDVRAAMSSELGFTLQADQAVERLCTIYLKEIKK